MQPSLSILLLLSILLPQRITSQIVRKRFTERLASKPVVLFDNTVLIASETYLHKLDVDLRLLEEAEFRSACPLMNGEMNCGVDLRVVDECLEVCSMGSNDANAPSCVYHQISDLELLCHEILNESSGESPETAGVERQPLVNVVGKKLFIATSHTLSLLDLRHLRRRGPTRRRTRKKKRRQEGRKTSWIPCENAELELKCLCRRSGSRVELSNCSRDGAWSSWSEWSECAGTGRTRGSRQRHRRCSDPPPLGDGRRCVGVRVEREECVMAVAEFLWGDWTAWGEWSGRCSSRRCPQQGKANEFQRRRRLCTASACEGCEWEIRECPVVETGCGEMRRWSPWTEWTVEKDKLSSESRYRASCAASVPSADLLSSRIVNETRSRHNPHHHWSTWTTQRSGIRHRFRILNTGRVEVELDESAVEAKERREDEGGICFSSSSRHAYLWLFGVLGLLFVCFLVGVVASLCCHRLTSGSPSPTSAVFPLAPAKSDHFSLY